MLELNLLGKRSLFNLYTNNEQAIMDIDLD